MSKLLLILVTFAFGLTAVTTASGARTPQPQLISFSIQNVGDGSESCPGALFGISFDMVSPTDARLGSGVSCIRTFDGCNFLAGCRDTIGSEWLISFEQGDIRAPVVIGELWPTDNTVIQFDHGTVGGGSGSFEGVAGSITCAGAITFTDTATVPRLACLVHLA